MSKIINHNGTLKKAGELLFDENNRAFCYGDGLFETIRVFNGKIPFARLHFERLLRGLQILQFEMPEYYQEAFFVKEIQKLTNNSGNHRIRLNLYRSGGGLYTPKNNQPEFLITSSLLENSGFVVENYGVNLGIYDEMRLHFNAISALKTNNALPYTLAGIYAQKHHFDECLLLNTEGNLVESISSNLFVIKNESIFTPILSEGCIAGTMRQLIFNIAKVKGFEIREIKVSLSRLLDADEIWLTNAVQGIRWVQHFKEKQFGNYLSVRFVNYLNDIIKTCGKY